MSLSTTVLQVLERLESRFIFGQELNTKSVYKRTPSRCLPGLKVELTFRVNLKKNIGKTNNFNTKPA